VRSGSVVNALADHVRDYGTGGDGLLFLNLKGVPLRRQQFRTQVWDPAVKAVGITDTPHALRHFYASLLIREGLSVKLVQTLLGHADPAETLRVYSHLWKDDSERARSAIAIALANRSAGISRALEAPET
jgi:site-specific recombinase XerD